MFKLEKFWKSLLSSFTNGLGNEPSHSKRTGSSSQDNQRRDGTEFRGILNDLDYFVFVALAKPLAAFHNALEAGPNLNNQLRNGLTPLHLAVAAMKSYTRSEYPAVPAVIGKVLALLEAGANPNVASDKGSTSVHISAAFDTPEVLVLLHSKGGSITAKDVRFISSSVYHFPPPFRFDHHEVHFFCPSLQQIHGNTPLHIAVACRSTATVRTILALLSSSRANHRTSSDHASPEPIDAVNNLGETALLLALRLAAEWKWGGADAIDFADAHVDAVQLQAPSSSPDKNDDLTTSHERKYLKYILIAEQLVSSGADTSLVNKDGMSARDLCAHLGLTVEGLYSSDETSCGENGTADREMDNDATDGVIDICLEEGEIGETQPCSDSHDVSAPLETPEPSFYTHIINDTAAEPAILLPSMQEAIPLYLLAPPPPSLVRPPSLGRRPPPSLGGRSRSTRTTALAVEHQTEEALVQEAGLTAIADTATTVFVATDIPCNVLPTTSFYSHLPGNDARYHSLSRQPSAGSTTSLSPFIVPSSTFTVPPSTSSFTVPQGWAWSNLYSPSPSSASPPATSPPATSLPATLFVPGNGPQTHLHAPGGDAASQTCTLGEHANVLLSPKKISALTERLCPLTRAVLALDLHAVTDLLKDGADANGWYYAPRVSALHVPPVSRAVLLGKTGKGDGGNQAKTNGKCLKSETGPSKINGDPHDMTMVEEAKNDSDCPLNRAEKPYSDTQNAANVDLLSFESNSQPIQVARSPRYITHAPLLVACWLHATAIGSLLLRRGAAVNVVDAAGNTPLLLVCRHHSGEIGRRSASRCGEESDRANMSEMNDHTLFDGSFPSAEPRSPSPCTETNTASLDLMLQLLFFGAAPNVANSAGATPLSVCAENNDIARMRVLLAFSADPNSGITWSPFNQFSGKRERDIRLRAKGEGEQEGASPAASGESAAYGSILAPAKVVNGSDVLNIHDKHVIVGPESPIFAKNPSPHPTESGINDNSTKSKKKPLPRLSLDPQAHIPLTSHPKFASHNALRWAVAWCNAEMVELLTRYGAHADICDERGIEGKLLHLVDAMMLADEAIVARGCGCKREEVMRDRTVTDASREDMEVAPSEPNARDGMIDSTLDCDRCREGTTDVRSVAQVAFYEREDLAARERLKKWPRIREMLLAARAVNDEEHVSFIV